MGNSESARRQRSEAGHTTASTSSPHTRRPRTSLLRRTSHLLHRVEVPSNSQTRRVAVPPGCPPRPTATQSAPVSPLGPAAAVPCAGAAVPASEGRPDACTPTADTRATVSSPHGAADSTCSSPLIGPRNNTAWIDDGSEPLPAGAADLLGGGDLSGSAGASRQTSSTAEQMLEQALRERQSHSIARVRDWLGSVDSVAGTA